MTDLGTTATAAPNPSDVQTPGQPTPTPSLLETDKYKGKTAEDLARMHAEAERKLGEQGNEVGMTRAQIAELQAQVEFLAAQALQSQQQVQAPPPQAIPEPDVTDNDWITNPTGAVKKLMSRELDEKLGQLTQLLQRQQVQIAQNNYLSGMERAMNERPDLFKGVENETKKAVLYAAQSGKLNPESLRDPETWYATAILMGAKKAGYKLPAQPGMNAPSGEMPSGNRIPGGGTQPQHRIVTTDKDLDVDSFENYLKKKGRFTDEDVAWVRNPNTGR